MWSKKLKQYSEENFFFFSSLQKEGGLNRQER